MYQNYNVGSAEPTAFITVRKQRQKQNGKSVYLHDRTEFEIELHNPTNDSILAKISLNGNRISNSGIVLKPGQRVFLERYLDEDRKFLFETYEVSDTKTNQRAIENNGVVVVEFFNKMVFNNPYNGYTYYNSQPLYGSGIINGNPVTINTTTGLVSTTTFLNTSTSDAKIETGRVEKGNKSDQGFDSSYEMFNSNVSWIREWKILPYSAKDKTTKDLVKKCPKCETKLKDNFKFCPQCGNQMLRTKTEIRYTTYDVIPHEGQQYIMSTYNDTLDSFLEKHKNKLIYIKTDSLFLESLRAVVIN